MAHMMDARARIIVTALWAGWALSLMARAVDLPRSAPAPSGLSSEIYPFVTLL